MDEQEYRPIERADYERAYAVLHALQMAREEPETPVWEHLIFLHEEKVENDVARQPSEELTGDSGFSAEFNRALVLLERLKLGQSDMPVVVGPSQRVCSAPGCGQRTVGLYCLHCELDRGSGDSR